MIGLQQQVNSVSTRHIQPNGHGSFDFVWTHLGFDDDSEEMAQRRLRQANLFGPAGFVSADDGEVIEFSQQAFETKPFHRTLAELGGREVADTEHMVTETLIRGMYRYWREDAVYATDNSCTHGQARLCDGFLECREIECPLHQGRFDVRDGKPLCEPVTEALRRHPVKIEGGRVFLQID
jgi:nitrite reductase/ring-hydroxylating ferredoxin subunit